MNSPSISIGSVFGQLTVVAQAPHVKGKHLRWVCECACGEKRAIASGNLLRSRSCGCRGRRRIIDGQLHHRCRMCATYKTGDKFAHATGNVYDCAAECKACYTKRSQQAHARDPRIRMLKSAKKRAGIEGTPFNITLEDIPVAPSTCPILGISVQYVPGNRSEHSPSIDKVIPALGYVVGNVNVISSRANRLKSDASLAELEAICDYIKKHS